MSMSDAPFLDLHKGSVLYRLDRTPSDTLRFKPDPGSRHPLLGLQQSLGNRRVQRLVERGAAAEREAGRVGEGIMRMPVSPGAHTALGPAHAHPVERPAPSAPRAAEGVVRDLGSGTALTPALRNYFEPRLGWSFSNVRLHTNARAAQAARALDARAFTLGSHVVFGAGHYAPATRAGRGLLAHELTHVVQQARTSTPVVQRQGVTVRSPVVEETLIQYSQFRKSRYLSPDEIKLAKTVFGKSIDYSRVRFIASEGKGVDWRVVGNTIREPKGFTIKSKKMAQTFIHEMTHIWQYQHYGSNYISHSLADNLVAWVRYKNRNKAYEYKIVEGKRFHEYRVEQQGGIVERYFEIMQELKNPKLDSARKSALEAELKKHQPLIDQMRASMPLRESTLLLKRASDVMGVQQPDFMRDIVPRERRLLPIKPLIQVEF